MSQAALARNLLRFLRERDYALGLKQPTQLTQKLEQFSQTYFRQQTQRLEELLMEQVRLRIAAIQMGNAWKELQQSQSKSQHEIVSAGIELIPILEEIVQQQQVVAEEIHKCLTETQPTTA